MLHPEHPPNFGVPISVDGQEFDFYADYVGGRFLDVDTSGIVALSCGARSAGRLQGAAGVVVEIGVHLEYLVAGETAQL